MFSNIKSTFGSTPNNTSFGFSGITPIQSNPFGQPAFGKPSNTSFTSNTPAFGSAPAPLFGSPQQHGTNLFGSGTSAFGQQVSSSSTFGTPMFGSTPAQQSTTSLFGQPAQTNNAFGQQNKTFGFGSNTSSSGFFGQTNTSVQPQQSSSGLFGTGTTSLFGSPSQGFGSTPAGAPTGTVVKFQLVTGTDTMVKGSINQTISTRHHCITCMKEYEGKSLEELRWEDYQANRKGPQQGSQPSGLFGISQPVGGGLFGSSSIATSTPLFGAGDQNKSVFGTATATAGFGQPSSSFGQPAASSSSGLFGKPIGAFGTNTSTSSAFSFNPGGTAPLFGGPAAQKPFGVTSSQPNTLFGQPSSGFGTQTSGFGSFGTTTNQNTSLFGQNKTTPFNMGTQNTGAFGSFNTTTSQPGSVFAVKQNQPFPSFGATNTATPLFSQPSSFGQPNQSLFNSSLNKPQTNLFGQPQTNTPGSTNLSLGTGNSLFGNKPLGTGTMFGQSTGVFNTGFNSNPLNNSFMMPGQQGAQTIGQPAVQNPNQTNNEQQIISMVHSPFGLNAHLNSFNENKPNIQDLSRPTNPNELKQLLNTVSKPQINSPPDKLEPKQIFGRKVPIFDGLEQRDEEIENFKINSPNPRRLLLRNRDRIKALETDSDSFLDKSNLSSNNDVMFRDFNTSVQDIGTSTQLDQDIQQNVTDKIISSPSVNSSDSLKKGFVTEKQIDGVEVLFEEKDKQPSNEQFEDAQQTLDNTDSNETFEDLRKADETAEIIIEDNSEENPVPKEPHPTGIVCTRPEYYTKPSLDELINYIGDDKSCVVQGFTIGRIGYGNVRFSEAFDVSNLNIDELVFFRDKEINIYPDESKKPPLGNGLNRKAQVTLDKVWPYDKKKKIIVKDVETLVQMDYAERLRKLCEKQGTRFVDYRPETGSWVFKVEHFSKYGHRDSDDSDIDEVETESDLAKIQNANKETTKEQAQQGALKKPTQLISRTEIPIETMPVGDVQKEINAGILKADLIASTVQVGLLGHHGDSRIDDGFNISYGLDHSRSYATKAMFHMSNFDIGDMLEEDGDSASNYLERHTDEFFPQLSNYPSKEKEGASVLFSGQYHRGDEIEDELMNTDLMEDNIPANIVPVGMIDDYYSDSDLEEDEESIQEEVLDDDVDVVPFETVTEMGIPDIGFKPDYGLLYSDVGNIGCLREEEFDEEVSTYEYTTIYERITSIPWADLSFSKSSLSDIVAFKGRSFKVGWGKNLTFASSILKGIESDSKLNEFGPEFKYNNTFPSLVHMVKVVPHNFENKNMKTNLNNQLFCQLRNSEFEFEGGLPWFKSRQGYQLIDEYKELNKSISSGDSSLKYNAIYAMNIWCLMHALFGDISTSQDVQNFDEITLRKKLLSQWFRDTLGEIVESLASNIKCESFEDDCKKILTYLSANKLEDAARHALTSKNPRLSLFISQIPCPEKIKGLIVQQISAWQDYKTPYVQQNAMKLYLLLAGVPAVNTHNTQINIFENMDWVRSLAIYFWYICEPSDPITKVLFSYEEAFTKYLFASKPTPFYNENLENINDLTYHLLKYFCSVNHPLQTVLNPITHTPDELDYSLSWFLMQTFSSLNLNTLTEEVQEQICVNFAARLESIDMWHWAIFVLLFIKNIFKKKHLINEMLLRHVRIMGCSMRDYYYCVKEEMLVKDFHIPNSWIDSAKADIAILQDNYEEAVHYLKYSQRYTEMHRTIFKHVTPYHIICYKYDYVNDFLQLLKKSSKHLENWNGTGEFILNVIELTKLFHESMNERNETGKLDRRKLLHIRSLIITINSQISQFPELTYFHSICLAEISSRVLEMINILFSIPKIKSRHQEPDISRDTSFKDLMHTIEKYILNTDYNHF